MLQETGMRILVDSSVWIDYFKGGVHSQLLDRLIENNSICINNLILAELIPFIKIRKQTALIELLYSLSNIPLAIQWQKIIDYQCLCLKNGVNRIGIPDLIIVDNAIQNSLSLYTLDKHFIAINKFIEFRLV